MRILTVVDYDEMWPTLFENERTLLQMTLGKVISRIHHIGSTSVPGLSAKPVIDILIEVANLEELDSLNQAMEGVGYTVRGEYYVKMTATDTAFIKRISFRNIFVWRLLMRVTWASLQINYNPCFFCNFSQRYLLFLHY